MESQNPADDSATAVITESAPVTTEVPETAVTTESAPVAGDETTEQNPKAAGSEPEQSKVVKELITQRKRRQVAETEAAYYKGIAEGRGHVASTQQTTTPAAPTVVADQPPVAPNQDTFETWEEFEKADKRYMINLAKYELKQENNQMIAQQQQQQKIEFANQQKSKFLERMEKAAIDDPSILGIQDDNTFPMHKFALPILFESEVAPEILKILNADRKEAGRIYQLFNTNPMLAASELGKLEASLLSKPRPTPPKKVSQAPEPISTISAAGANTVDEDNLPMDEYYRRYNQNRHRR